MSKRSSILLAIPDSPDFDFDKKFNSKVLTTALLTSSPATVSEVTTFE